MSDSFFVDEKVDELIDLLNGLNMTLLRIEWGHNYWTVYAHNPKLSGRKPILDECRDAQDYVLLLSQWNKLGEFSVFSYETLSGVIDGAIEIVQKGI